MIVSRIDPESRSTIAAAEGFQALGRGDTVLAREKYGEAGRVLEAGAVQSEYAPAKNLLRFLAASQYYLGGEYQKALRIVRRTRPKQLSDSDRERFEAFRNDVEERAEAGYVTRTRQAIHAAWEGERWEVALQLLQGHPYVVDRAMLAWLRADLCLMSGRLSVAARLSAASIRFSDSHPTPIVLRSGGPLVLEHHGREDEARQYAELILGCEPTALDWVSAAVILFPVFQRGDSQAGSLVLQRFQRAREEFPKLTPQVVSDPDVRGWMAHGYFVAALTADQLHGRQFALELVAAAESTLPPAPYDEIFNALRSDSGDWTERKRLASAPAPLLAHRQRRMKDFNAWLRAA